MITRQAALSLLSPQVAPVTSADEAMDSLGFEDRPAALSRLHSLCETDAQRELFAEILPALLHALTETASADGSLLNFQKLVQCVSDRDALFQFLIAKPRAVEILVKLFVGSQFLTEILLRHPEYLTELTEHKRLAEFKTRQDLIIQGRSILTPQAELIPTMNELRRFHQWELLRLAACDTFGLMDLKTVTLQLALLADALVQLGLEIAAAQEKIEIDEFTVLAFGKLGGEELNYSSDIDLIFVCRQEAERYWGLGQKLIRILTDATDLGFLYRVDLRLRPWGGAGPLVSTADAYVEYISKHGRHWEKQALLKARPIAGNLLAGQSLMERLTPFIFDVNAEESRSNVRQMKQKIEEHLARKGQAWGEVKGGPGGIRDIEFLTQFLQLVHGRAVPEVRSFNTLDALVRLADFELIFPDEYRRLSGGYVFLRTIEHALQLMHNRQEHLLPRSSRGRAYLARRLDFPDEQIFVQQYELHTRAVKEVFERYLHHSAHPLLVAHNPAPTANLHFGAATAPYRETFSPAEARQHLELLQELGPDREVRVGTELRQDGSEQVSIVGYDRPGELAAICGLLFAHGFNIEAGHVFTGADAESAMQDSERRGSAGRKRKRKFINVFQVRRTDGAALPDRQSIWDAFEQELNDLILTAKQGPDEIQGRLARRVASVIESAPQPSLKLLPLEIEIDNESSQEATILHIRGEDTPGFLYELTNAIAVNGLSIDRMTIQSSGMQVVDTLHVVDSKGRKLKSGEPLHELRAAIVLIKHFTHLLPQSPNPESALIHFQKFLENLFQQPNWLDQLSPLHNSDVLAALAKLLGISNFLWDDFLRLQHENLFPVVTNVQGLERPRTREDLQCNLSEDLATCLPEERQDVLNAFKDREMMRVDMRHILGLQEKFGMFSQELTQAAEVVVEGALRICEDDLQRAHGAPRTADGELARLSVCALGKCGGRELGYASDIELMFIYDGEGQTSGVNSISNFEYFQRLVEAFRKTIHSKRKGIFEIDLRLRPFGKAGSLAVSLASFEKYFNPQGPAWPYERQALVKLRPIAGDARLGLEISQLRDQFLYRGEPFDVAAMRAMREKQNRQLVDADGFNAKLSSGGLVDCEYLVQGLQITFGHLDPAIREPNTREAMKALEARSILTGDVRIKLRDAYRFFRRLIDALRMVRGDASDLATPPPHSDEFAYLARRLGYGPDTASLRADLEGHTRHVQEMFQSLEALMKIQPKVAERSKLLDD